MIAVPSGMGRLATVLPMVCSLCGCRAIDRLRTDDALRRLARDHAKAARQYQEAVASHAANEQLLGTWVRSGRLRKEHGLDVDETVALFSDGSYVRRRVEHGFPLEVVMVVTGEWEKTGPGRIKLTWADTATGHFFPVWHWGNHEDRDPRGETWLVIDLKEWANTFVQADADLMSEKNLESRNEPVQRTPP